MRNSETGASLRSVLLKLWWRRWWWWWIKGNGNKTKNTWPPWWKRLTCEYLLHRWFYWWMVNEWWWMVMNGMWWMVCEWYVNGVDGFRWESVWRRWVIFSRWTSSLSRRSIACARSWRSSRRPFRIYGWPSKEPSSWMRSSPSSFSLIWLCIHNSS